MREEGVLESPRVDRIFGLHVWPSLDTGTVGAREGVFLAAASFLNIQVRGTGGHAAMPHQTVDPVTTSAKIVTELQTLVSREIDPLDSAVVSITSIHCGQAYNVIPESVEMQGTIRALSMPGLRRLQDRAREIVTGVAAANRCEAVIDYPGHDYPPTINDAGAWKLAQQVAAKMLGESQVLEIRVLHGAGARLFCRAGRP